MLVFLIFLAIAGIAACIFANSSQSTAELAGVATVLSLGMSLVYAPWEVKLLLLVLLLATTRPLLRPRTQEPPPITESNESQQQDLLQYRGISYQPASERDAAMPSRDGLGSGAAVGDHRAMSQTAAPDQLSSIKGPLFQPDPQTKPEKPGT